MLRRLGATALAVGLQSGVACVSVRRPTFMESAPTREWPGTRTAAQARVSEGKFDAADSVLAGFVERYRGTPEASEAAYWRALVKMDPLNPHGSLPEAITSLDRYLVDPRAHEHMREAAALRRVAAHLDELNKLAANAPAVPKDAGATPARSPADLRMDVSKSMVDPTLAADIEIKRLRDELAKATAELERIRKRLAQPPRNRR